MRWICGTFTFATAVAIVGLLALNWRAQLQTQQKLDALAAIVAERPVTVSAAPVAPAAPTGAAPHELSKVAPVPYVIEVSDQVRIEVAVKDPKTGAPSALPTQPVSGPFPVRPDGTVDLGFWGAVPVHGCTIEQASAAVRTHIARRAGNVPAENLVAIVDVIVNNSKLYCIIVSDGDSQSVWRLQWTGSETVLDAIANVGGAGVLGRNPSIRVSRPGRAGAPEQVLPVDWAAITQRGVTHTNYQLLPGDRVFVTPVKD